VGKIGTRILCREAHPQEQFHIYFVALIYLLCEENRHNDPVPHIPVTMPHSSAADDRPSKGVILRDLLLFQMKLWLDGFKDIVLSPISVIAAVLDMLRRSERSSLFYRTLQLGEGFDQWLNLYGAAQRAPHRASGLVGDDGDDVTRPLEVWGRRTDAASRRTPPVRQK